MVARILTTPVPSRASNARPYELYRWCNIIVNYFGGGNLRSSFSKTFYPFALLLLATLVLVGLVFLNLASRFLQAQTEEDMKTSCSAISDMAAAYLAEGGLTDDAFLVNLSVAAKVAQANVVICDRNGVVLVCSDSPLGCEHQGLHLYGSDLLQSLQTDKYVVTAGSLEGLYEDVRYGISTAIVHPKSGEFEGFVLLSMPVDRKMLAVSQLTDHYLLISALVVLIAVLVLTYFTRRNSNPLRDVARTATAFGHGDLKARANVPKNAPSEVRELALAFNNMAGSLEKLEQQRQDFVANVSHELKTPMTTISGYVDGILDGTIPADKQEKYLQVVSDETKRLNRLVRSMLDISRLHEQSIPEEKKSRFDLTEAVGQVLINLEQQILQKKLDVQVDMPDLPVYTLACRDYIVQVIYNLVDNAVKFCPEGGRLNLRLCSGGHKVYVTVSNQGETIPPQELPFVFDRFHKVDKSRSQNRDSWGLGLYIVKTIICSHGEDISVTSADGLTEFTFTLPLVN